MPPSSALAREPLARWFAWILGLATVMRLVAIAWWPPSGDEAYHWEWALTPQLGYYDHPPLQAWCMTVTTTIFGHSAWAMRLPSVLAGVALALLVCAFARRVGPSCGLDEAASRRAGCLAGIIATVSPIHTGLSVYATGDALVSLAWAWAAWAGLVALERGRARDCVHLGLALGVGVLAKFLIILLPLAIVIAALLIPPWRRHLLRWQPWLVPVTIAVVISPFLWWNSQHDWATFAFNFVVRHKDNADWYVEIPTYLGTQIAVLTPLLWLLGVGAAVRMVVGRDHPRALRYLGLVILVPLLVFLQNALTRRIGLHWPAVAYPALYVLLPLLWARGLAAPRLHTATIAMPAVLSGLALLVALIPPRLSVLPFMPPVGTDRDPPAAGETLGWDELATAITIRREQHGAGAPIFLCAAQYGFVGNLRFALDGENVLLWDQILRHGEQHRMWDDWAAHAGHDALFLTRRQRRLRTVAAKLSEHFAEVGEPEPIDVVVDGRLVNRVWLVPCRGFDGRVPTWE